MRPRWIAIRRRRRPGRKRSTAAAATCRRHRYRTGLVPSGEDERARAGRRGRDVRVHAVATLDDEPREARHVGLAGRRARQGKREIVDAISARERCRVDGAVRGRARRSAGHASERAGRAGSAHRPRRGSGVTRCAVARRVGLAGRLAEIGARERLDRGIARQRDSVEEELVRRRLADEDRSACRDERARTGVRVVAVVVAPRDRRLLEMTRIRELRRALPDDDGGDACRRLRAAGERERKDRSAVVADAERRGRDRRSQRRVDFQRNERVATPIEVADLRVDRGGHRIPARGDVRSRPGGSVVHDDGAREFLRSRAAPRSDSLGRPRHSARRGRARRSNTR